MSVGAERPASFGRRTFACVVDWLVCGLIVLVVLVAGFFVNIPLALAFDRGFGFFAFMEDADGETITYPGPVMFALWALALVGYYALAAREGATLGMQVARIRVVAARDRRNPTAATGIALAVLTFVPLSFLLFFAIAALPLDARRLPPVFAAVTLAALAGHGWTLVDRQRRSLQERLLGLRTVQGSRPREGVENLALL